MEQLLNKKQVASILGLSIYTIDKWVSERKHLPFTKMGSRVLFSQEDVEKFIQRMRVAPIEKGGIL